MHAIKLKTVIDETHKLQLELPPGTPTGEAEVIVLVGTSQQRDVATSRSVREWFEELDRSPRPRVAAEDVERWITDQRDAWD